jgi:hypothetical protein
LVRFDCFRYGVIVLKYVFLALQLLLIDQRLETDVVVERETELAATSETKRVAPAMRVAQLLTLARKTFGARRVTRRSTLWLAERELDARLRVVEQLDDAQRDVAWFVSRGNASSDTTTTLLISSARPD